VKLFLLKPEAPTHGWFGLSKSLRVIPHLTHASRASRRRFHATGSALEFASRVSSAVFQKNPSGLSSQSRNLNARRMSDEIIGARHRRG
jgi:hypothetical protein